MTTYIALLRGINVGGHRKVPMVELKALLTDQGLLDLRTYIQSGNVVFCSTESNTKVIEKLIKSSISDYFGFDVSVLVKTPEQLKRIFEDCPFKQAQKEQSYFAILSDIPSKDLVAIALEKVYADEYYHILNDCIYFYAKKGYGNAKFSLNYFEKKLQVSATARNYKTMLKLLSMSSEN